MIENSHGHEHPRSRNYRKRVSTRFDAQPAMLIPQLVRPGPSNAIKIASGYIRHFGDHGRSDVMSELVVGVFLLAAFAINRLV